MGSSARRVILSSCSDLSDEGYEAAVARRPHFLDLMHQLAEVAEPGQECVRVLHLLARVSEALWLDGDLRVEMMADDARTTFELLTELGGGLRERVCAPVTMRIPLGELVAAADREPWALEPLSVRSRSARRLVLLAGATTTKSTLPPPRVKVKGGSSIPPPPEVGGRSRQRAQGNGDVQIRKKSPTKR